MKCEPMERLVVDVPADAVGAVIEDGLRKETRLEMTPVGTRMKIEFLVPARGPVRLPQRIPHRHPGRGDHGLCLRLLRPYRGI